MVLVSTTVLPTMGSYILVLLFHSMISAVLITKKPIKIDSRIIFLLIIVFLISIYNVQTNPTIIEVFRTLIFTPFAVITIFIVPQYFSIKYLFKTVAWLSTIFVSIGIFIVIINLIDVNWIAADLRPTKRTVRLVPGITPETSVIRSVFSSQNRLAFLSLCGAVGGAAEYYDSRHRLYLLFSMISVYGLYLTQSRASSLGMLVVVVLILAYRLSPKYGMRLMTLGGILISGALFIIYIILQYNPPLQIDLSGRLYIWRGAVQTILDRPLFGWGFVDTGGITEQYIEQEPYAGASVHNSYLRMYLTTGIVGGTSYLALIFLTLYTSSQQSRMYPGVFIYSLLVGVLVVHFFETNTIYGLSMMSGIAALLIGYAWLYAIYGNYKLEERVS